MRTSFDSGNVDQALEDFKIACDNAIKHNEVIIENLKKRIGELENEIKHRFPDLTIKK